MIKAPLLKADFARWISTSRLFAIGKFLPLLIAPFLLLWSYGKIQSVQRKAAEQRVEQLTSDITILSRSLAQVEKYVAGEQDRANDNAKRIQVLNDDESQVLDMPAPTAIIDILRVVQSAGNN